ncbi:sulfatase-like hydrolase/transferase [Pseudotamlana haliotis]|nr:sulfatase-like hydrolase/transferase [Tamlana haliotis]
MKKNNIKLYGTYFLPILVAFVFELLFSSIYIERVYNVLENILFGFILLLPVQLLNGHKFQKACLKLMYLILVFTVFFETGYYLIFNAKFNASSVFIFSQTNYTEAKEFLSFYLDYRVYLLLFVLVVISLVFLKTLKKTATISFLNAGKSKILIAFAVLLSSLVLVSYTRRENLPFIVGKSFYDLNKDSYYSDLDAYKTKFGPFETIPSQVANDSKETIVVVIGESTSRRHLGLYGYERNTTPLLNILKPELVVYDNVISPHALTVETLKKALTLNVDDANGTIVQLLNRADYKTFWLSNQNPIGLHESFVSKVANASDKTVFLTAARFMNNKVYDENLNVHLEKALADKAKKKVVFIHLQGTHFDYKYRYPESFEVFRGATGTKFQSDKANQVINTYDNAVLYNDFVVSSFVETLKKNEKHSALLYFSDHGEEVYDSMEFVGHTDDVGSLPMFQIPFILWQSKDFKSTHESRFEFNPKRPYITEGLFHSIADLCDVESTFVNPKKSIFNSNFVKQKRIILNNKDYDSLLLKEQKTQFN